MTSSNGQLAFSPEELQQPKRGIAQQAQESEAKQTYVIIIKQDENSSEDGNGGHEGTLQILKSPVDSLRKNLATIDDDEYDSGISAANLFLQDDEREDAADSEGLVLPLAKRTRILEDPSPFETEASGVKGFVKRNLFCEGLSPISPPTGTCHPSLMFTSDSPEIIPTTVIKDATSFTTPTASQDFRTHPAARKIVLVSPDQCPSSTVMTPPAFGGAVKALYAPSPLASSTPVTSETALHVSTTSPDSGISLSVSSLSSSSILTPSVQEQQVFQPVKTIQSTPDMVPSLVTSMQCGPGAPIETKITFRRRTPIAQPERKDSDQSDDGVADKSLDTSLANIQWLGAFQLGGEKTKIPCRADPQTVATRWTSEERGRRKEYNQGEISRVNRECGRTKRPPYSYMVLIQMALQSRPDLKMTLREICKWIEDTFSFYKYTAKPGWKSSIRHNLSYYQCFVRTSEDKKKHGARWTVKFDDDRFDMSRVYNKDKLSVGCGNKAALPNMIPVIVNQNNTLSQSVVPLQSSSLSSVQQACFRRRREGPMPILPRPTPVQAYALVPLQSLQQQQQPQQPTVQSNTPLILHIPPASQPLQTATTTPATIHTNIVPKINTVTETVPLRESVNILRQAWLHADISEDENTPTTSTVCENTVTIKRGSKGARRQSKASANKGLPKPKLYPAKSKKKSRKEEQKTQQLAKEKGLAESSDSEPDVQFEKGLPTPLRQFFQSPDAKNRNEMLTTSTPLRNATISSDYLPSPIHGFTPPNGTATAAFDGSFLDIFQEEAAQALKLVSSPQGLDGQKLGRSPNTSLTEFGIFQISPDKGTRNLSDFPGLSRIFPDFDTNFIADTDGLPIDMTNFNWSGLQHSSVSPKEK